MNAGDRYAAHIIRDEEGRVISVQSIQDHVFGVAKLAQKFAEVFGMGDYAYECGLAHDIGKYSAGFQKHIWDGAPRVDHSTAGAREIQACYSHTSADEQRSPGGTGVFAAYCIAGHHAGLQNGGGTMDADGKGTLSSRFNKKLEDYSRFRGQIQLEEKRPGRIEYAEPGNAGFQAAFLIRMLFSCLVDADFLDTEKFMQSERFCKKENAYGEQADKSDCATYRDAGESIELLANRLDFYLMKRQWRDGKEGLNGWRSRILNECIAMGDQKDSGLFTLTVATGGGKTISSLAFALHNAVHNHQKRIIYVIPYCSIIDQTVAIFKDILGENNVLAHYSEAQYSDLDDSINHQDNPEKKCRADSMRLAAENWDKPVIVTTAVQFFESLFSNRTSACRKLHNIADSVIIFDEAQTFPLNYLEPCAYAIAELSLNYHSSCVLCTATQPSLGGIFQKYTKALVTCEICSDTEKMYEAFRRVHYENIGMISDQILAKRLQACPQVLCIVSTKAQAANVYHLLAADMDQNDVCIYEGRQIRKTQKADDHGIYHLSTLMTPEHRKKTLEEIRTRLRENKNCQVVSTSLIEAGVDVDFPVVYRAAAGLDSEIQAAGRCNREGKHSSEESTVYIFSPEACYRTPSYIRRNLEETKFITDGKADIAALSVVKEYFDALYHDTGTALDQKDIVMKLNRGCNNFAYSFPFKDVATEFKLIDQNTRSVFIPRDEETRKLAESLQGGWAVRNRDLYRRLGRYTVNVFENHYERLQPFLISTDDGIAILAADNLYDPATGLSLQAEGGREIFE